MFLFLILLISCWAVAEVTSAGVTIFVAEITSGQFHVTTDTTQKNKSSFEYLVLVLYCTHITCHGFKGNIQIQT